MSSVPTTGVFSAGITAPLARSPSSSEFQVKHCMLTSLTPSNIAHPMLPFCNIMTSPVSTLFCFEMAVAWLALTSLLWGCSRNHPSHPVNVFYFDFYKEFPRIIDSVCMGVLAACTSVHHARAVPLETRKGHQLHLDRELSCPQPPVTPAPAGPSSSAGSCGHLHPHAHAYT